MVKRFVILLCFFSFVIPIKAAKNHTELQINENLLKSTKKKSFKKHNKTIVFLWREEKYNKKYKTTFSEICINQSYCKTITDPERAVIGYIATFIGSDCNWDDECNADRSNLKCKLLSALILGYQCSDTHLGFLKKNGLKGITRLQKDLKIVQLRPTQQLFKTRLRKWNQRIQITISISLYTPLV